MSETISWVATAATIIGAFLTAANLGARVTGSGFAVFLVGSLSWLATGIMTGQPALTWTNVVLTVLNILGVWRWLGRQAGVEEGGRTAAERSAKTPGEALFPVSLLSRGPVTANGESVGSCIDAMAGCRSGRIDYVVISQGGMAGVGETLRRLPWTAVRVEQDEVIARLSAADFDGLEELQRDRWPGR
jgi:hypothetical protein